MRRRLWFSRPGAVVAVLQSSPAPAAGAPNGTAGRRQHQARERSSSGVCRSSSRPRRPEAVSALGACRPRSAADPPVGDVRQMPGARRRRRQLPLPRVHAPRASASTSRSGCRTGTGVHHHGHDFPAGDCRNDGVPERRHRRADRNLIGRVRHQHLPEGVGGVQRAARPGRVERGAILGRRPFGIPDYYGATATRSSRSSPTSATTNFYDLNNANRFSYIAGFFSSQINDFFDRNVMTIDAFDWLHRTGANPPDEPVPGDNCTSAPARPLLYEGVFAHEYQHLLERYEDPDEFNWINEGLSDWAQTLTGYVEPGKPITEKGFDSHIQCFLGWLGVATPVNPNPRATCGPENSLTRWGDQGDGEILARLRRRVHDDGVAPGPVRQRLHDRAPPRRRERPRRSPGGARRATATSDGSTQVRQDVLHDWSLMVALDGLIDDGYSLGGRAKREETSRRRRSTRRSTGTRRTRTTHPALRRTAPTTSGCGTRPATT